MAVYTRCIALFLLALFIRVLVPDSFILALHKHTHTVEQKFDGKESKHQLATKHSHCQTDHLFNNSYYTLPSAVELPVIITHATAFQNNYVAIWKFTFPNNISLRGPPTLFSS